MANVSECCGYHLNILRINQVKSLYLILLLASFAVPFVYSFEKKMNFIKHWKAVFLSIALVASFYIVWDVIFTYAGVWGFNPDYFIGLTIFKLPIEEWMFFILIPYASLFIHYALQYFFPAVQLSDKLVKWLTITLIGILFLLVLLFFDRLYTLINSLVLIGALILGLKDKFNILNRFFLSYLVILIPFTIVNGILTGSFIPEPIVWYNNQENLGIRFFTIPLEDFGYTFSLMFLNLLLIERFKIIFNTNK